MCDSDVTFTAEPVGSLEHRVLVTEDGDTVVQTRGTISLDVSRASDGAALEDVELDAATIETLHADELSFTIDRTGPALVIVTDEAEVEALAEAGLPPAFIYPSGRLMATITLEPGSDATSEEPPAVADVELVEITAASLFDLCHLFDQAAAEDEEGASAP